MRRRRRSIKINFLPNNRVHARFYEYSAAYVYNLTFKKFNPFAEVGVGAFMYSPIDDQATQGAVVGTTKKVTNIGFLYGAGIAYELSPSFDLRVQYRGPGAEDADHADYNQSEL